MKLQSNNHKNSVDKNDGRVPMLKPSSLRFGKLRGSGTFSDIVDIDFGPLSDDEDDLKNNNETNNFPGLLISPLKRMNTRKNMSIKPDNNIVRNTNTSMRNDNIKSHSMPSLNIWLNSTNKNFSFRNISNATNTNTSPHRKKKPKNLVAKVPRHVNNKKLHKESIDCLKTEADILSQLSHEHIIKIHGVSSFTEESTSIHVFAEHYYFIILEELTTTLDKKLLNRGELSFLERLDILFDLASALKYMHEKGIIHRDIKPANVGFDSNGDLKLFDFGLAIQITSYKKNRNGLYDLDGGFGTCRYMVNDLCYLV